MKRVLIEGSIFSRQVASGISNYLGKLIELGIGIDSDPQIDSKVLLLEPNPENIFLKGLQVDKALFQFDTPARFYRRIITGSFNDVNLFHSPYMFLPRRSRGMTNLLTVHDLINLRQPFSVRAKSREMMLRLAISRADHFICISDTTKNELLNFYPVTDPARVHVIHQGIDETFHRPDPGEQVSLPDKPFILYVGARDGYKNFQALLSFYQNSRWKNDIDILCVGGGPFNPAEQTFIHSNNLERLIRHTGFISTGQLKTLYQNAFALAYTSTAEGFGLPILEAMASQCPVICGNFSSMKEVAGGNAILVDDFSAESIDAALRRVNLLTPSDRERARKYSQNFTWKKTALNTMALYQSLLQ